MNKKPLTQAKFLQDVSWISTIISGECMSVIDRLVSSLILAHAVIEQLAGSFGCNPNPYRRGGSSPPNGTILEIFEF